MNIERLQTLAHHLRHNVNPLTFDMRQWNSCALGRATDIPEFRRDGLEMLGGIMPGYGRFRAEGAAMAFFDLDERQACPIFSGIRRSPSEVADTIDLVIADEIERRNEIAFRAVRSVKQLTDVALATKMAEEVVA